MYIPKTGPWSDGDEFPDFLDVEGAPAVARRHLANFGGKGGGSQTQTQNTGSRTELPDWVTDAAKKNLAQAYTVSQNLMGPYAGQRVANLPPGLLADIGALQ